MAYTPPDKSSIAFTINSGEYTPPAKDNLNFYPGQEEGENVYVNCLEYPFQTTSNFSSTFMIEVQIPLSPLQSLAQVDAGILWYYPVSPLTGIGDLAIPNILITVQVTPFQSTCQFTAAAQHRVRLQPLSSGVSILAIQSITVVPEGTTVVSPWPMESLGILEKPYLAHILAVPPFVLSNSFNVPLITAGTTTTMSMSPFELISTLSADLSAQISINPFTMASQLRIDYIKVMPEGDQYLGMPPFVETNTLQNPIIQSGFLMTPFESNNSFEVDNIFVGINLEVEPFVLSDSFVSLVSPTISCAPMVISSRLASEVNVNLWVPPFTLTSSLDVFVYTGDYVVCGPFQMMNRITTGMGFSIDLLPFPLIQNSRLAIPSTNLFVQLNPLTGQSSLDVDNIYIFTLDYASVFYFFTLTGAENGLSDVRIPISSFQARLRNGDPTYLQVVIPGVLWATEISLRPDGVLQVSMGYKVNGEIVREKIIVSANLESIRLDSGTDSQSITLSGHKTETVISKSIDLTGAIYKNITDGKYRYRIAEPNMELNAGDTVTIDGETFTADLISYYASASTSGIEQNMEISQA